MATQTQTLLKEQQTTLQTLIRAWDRRLRLQQFIRWLPFSVLPGLLIGVTLGMVSRFQPFMRGEQILNYTLAVVGGGLIAFVLGILLYPRSINHAAHKFDLLFRLNERVSTALEIIGGRIQTNAEFTQRQLDDTLQKAQTVRAGEHLPLVVRWRDWAIVVVLAGVLALMLLLPNPLENQIAAPPEANPAIEEAADTLRDITEDVAADPTLSEEERDSLLEELETSIDTLEQDDITTEEAFSELSDVQSELQQRADSAGEQLANQQSANTNAQQSLNGAFPEGEQASPEALTGEAESLNEQLDEIAELGENAENPQSLADALRDAASALQNTNPQAAEALNNAAQALENGDMQSFEDSINAAQDAIDDAGTQQQNLQQSQATLQEGANQAQQAQQNLQQPEQASGQPQAQEGESGESQEGDQQAFMLATPEDGQQAQQGVQGQEGQQGQQGEQGEQGAPQAQGGQQGGLQGQQGTQPQQGIQGAQSNSSTGASAGAGDSEGGTTEQGFQSDGSQIDTDNNPDGEGVEEFDPIYAPQRVGGDGGPAISLESEDGSSPLVEGEFSENPTGQSVVPYNEVFSDYSNQASEALESDYIPLGMRDLVRDYFTSIEPGQ